jgi:hypothetical protein
MTTDSRYTVTDWLRAHAGPDETIASTGALEYVAIKDGLREAPLWVSTLEGAQIVRPTFLVWGVDPAAGMPSPAQDFHDALLDGSAGYRIVLRVRSRPIRLPWLHPDLGEHPRIRPVFSSLSQINPTLEVFERLRER